jgi:thiamine-monophosphate kinase
MPGSPLPPWNVSPGEPTLSQVGEMEILRRIRRFLEGRGHVPAAKTFLELGPGDDAALVRPSGRFPLALTCDIHVEGQHFRTDLLAPIDLGRRVMVSNISDLAAMGAIPRTALVSMALPSNEAARALFEMIEGLSEEIEDSGGVVAGGNLSMTTGPRVVDVTLVGEMEGEAFLRSGAGDGDDILLIGSTGEAAAGLWCLENLERKAAEAGAGRLYVRPRHWLRESRRLRDLGGVKALIDTSDGFASDLSHVCEASGVGAEVEVDTLPVSRELEDAARRAGRDPLEWVLGPSDDYALVAAVDPGSSKKILTALGPVVRRVGRFVSGSGVCFKGRDVRQLFGWDHFRESP